MPKYSNRDRYLDVKSGILKNLLGITKKSFLEAAEVTFVALRSYELAQKPLKGKFNLAHLKAIHRYLFRDVYAWAGKCRTIDINRGKTFFAHHAHLEKAAAQIFKALAKERLLAGLKPSEFSERAAYYLAEINALHPFREGNGRAQREFISHIAYKNGYYIEWKNMNQKEMIHASIESFHGDYSKFAAYIRRNIRVLS